jgi:hypothetical protein
MPCPVEASTVVPESMVNVAFPGIEYRPLVSRVPAHMDLYCFYLKTSDSPLLESMLAIVQAGASV